MGLVGDWIRVFKGPDKYKTISNVKNPEIARLNTGLMGDFDRSGRETESSLSDFTSKYLSAQPTREAQTGQETGAIDRYYDGSFDSMLAGIRANRANALRTAGDRAIGYAARGRKSDSLLSPGGGSSYFDRLALGQTGDIEAKIALDGAEQEKQDLLSAEQARFNLLGRRGALGDATIGRLLYPAQLREQSLARRTAELSGLENIDLANTFYGLQKKRSSLDKAADIADLSERTIIQLAAMYFGGLGGVAGAAGGAGAGMAGMGGGSMGGGNMAAMAGMAGGLGGGSGAGNASLYGSQPGQTSWSFANMFKADGGPVEEDMPYVVGEQGPEMFVPEQNGTIVPNPSFAPPIGSTDVAMSPEEKMAILQLFARMTHGTQPNPAVDPQSGPWNAPYGPAEMAPQSGVWNEPSGPIDIASSAQPSQVPAKRQRDPQETRRRFEDILRNYQAFDTGPAPTSTPVGDSYSSVQAADDRGNQMRSQRTGIVAERINNLIQQRRDEEWKKAQEQTRRAEMADAVARRAQEETIRHKEASEQLRQGQERINVDKDRNKIYDRREIQAQTEQTTRDTGRDNSAEFNEAYQGVTSGLITSPEQLGGFRFLRPEQVQRLASYIGSVESQDREQDAYVTNATSAFNGRILNERRKKAQTELAAEKNKWKYGLSGKRDDDKITNLEEAIRTGEGLPPLKEGELQKYIDQLAKDRNLSQLGRFDEQTQMLVPILKAKPLSGARPAPSTPAPAAAPATNKPTFRYNRDGQLIR